MFISFIVGAIFAYTTVRIFGEILQYFSGDYVDRKIYLYDLAESSTWESVVIFLHLFFWVLSGSILLFKGFN